MGRGGFIGQTAIAIATVAISTTQVSAQAASPTSPELTFSLSTTVRADNNRNLDVVSQGSFFEVYETLSFGFLSETQTQILNLQASGALRYVDRANNPSEFGFDYPDVSLAYSRIGAVSDFNASGYYRQIDIIDTKSTGGNLVPIGPVFGAGTLTSYGAAVGLNLGTQSPLGFVFNARANRRDYQNQTDPSLNDSTYGSVDAGLVFVISPSTTANLTSSFFKSTTEDAANTDVDTRSLTAGITHDLRAALTLNAQLGFRENKTTDFGILTQNEGLFGTVGATRLMPNGSAFGDISFDVSDIDDYVALTFGRQLDLRSGTITASLTARDAELSGTNLLGNVAYQQTLPNGGFSVDFNQGITADINNQDTLYSQLTVSYTRNLTPVASLTLDFDISRSADAGGGTLPEKNRADFTASYSHMLTSDWDVSVGYQHRRYQETNIPVANSDSIFLTLTRNVALGF